MAKIYTISEFADKYNLSRATVWRWVTIKRFQKRLKMYDAAPSKTDGGKLIIEQYES